MALRVQISHVCLESVTVTREYAHTSELLQSRLDIIVLR